MAISLKGMRWRKLLYCENRIQLHIPNVQQAVWHVMLKRCSLFKKEVRLYSIMGTIFARSHLTMASRMPLIFPALSQPISVHCSRKEKGLSVGQHYQSTLKIFTGQTH